MSFQYIRETFGPCVLKEQEFKKFHEQYPQQDPSNNLCDGAFDSR